MMGNREDFYYIVHGGKSLDAINACVDGVEKFFVHCRDMARKYGAKEAVTRGGGVIGLIFAEPQRSPWIHNRKYRYADEWRPDKRIKEGAAIATEIQSVRNPSLSSFADALGGGPILLGCHIYNPLFEKIGNQYILHIPKLVDGALNLGFAAGVQFVPPPDVTQIKTSEYWKMKEAHNG